MEKDGDITDMGLWPYITGGDDLTAPAAMAQEDRKRLSAHGARFAHLVGPVMAGFFLENWRGDLDIPDFSEQELENHRLSNRFRHFTALKWARFMAPLKVNPVYMKGFATAFDLYHEPEVRTINDIDILLDEKDVPALVAALEEEGFYFSKSSKIPLWGFISDASFLPFINPSDYANIDIHIRPDDFPVHRSLGISEIRERSRVIEKDGFTFQIPCRDHLLLLAITNAARDKFDQECLKSLLDALLILTRHGAEVDWPYLERLAKEGGYLKPVATFLELALRLGVRADHLPGHLLPHYGGAAKKAFEEIVTDFANMFPERPGRWSEIRREFLLTAQPRSIAWKYGRRLMGLIRPLSGLPPKKAPPKETPTP